MKVETLTPDNVMMPIGPYSHIAKAGPFVWISGTAGVDSLTGLLAGPDAYAQARADPERLRTMLESVGSDMEHVMHVHVFLKNMDDFEEMNRAYGEAFGKHLPARTVVGVGALPKKDALMTMNLNAVVTENAGQSSVERGG